MIKKEEITFTVECLAEDIPIEGNVLASGDDEEDRMAEEAIRKDLDLGNPWAWCCIKVTGRWEGLAMVDYLGCCSFSSEQDFMEGSGCYEDMTDEVVHMINEQAKQIAKRWEVLTTKEVVEVLQGLAEKSRQCQRQVRQAYDWLNNAKHHADQAASEATHVASVLEQLAAKLGGEI